MLRIGYVSVVDYIILFSITVVSSMAILGIVILMIVFVILKARKNRSGGWYIFNRMFSYS